jgi:Protein of unknown function (DUF4239)
MRWVVTDVPTWVVGVVLILGLPTLAVLIKFLLNRKAPSLATGSHNDVAGYLVAIVAVVYAVVVGFTIVSLYEASAAANEDVSTEASDLLQLHNANFVLGPQVSARINADIDRYATAVIDNWTTISEGIESTQVTHALNDVYVTLDAYTPRTAAETDYLSQSIDDADALSEARVARQLEASESGSLPLVLWIVILLTSLVTLAFALVFSVDNVKIAYAMVAGVAAVLAVNIFVLVELGYPFVGSVSVGPGKFEAVIHLVSG